MIYIREGPVESWGIYAYEADKFLRTVRSARLRYCFIIYYSQGHLYLWHGGCLVSGGSADINYYIHQKISLHDLYLFYSDSYLCDYLNLYAACW
jgi:hypothetical protein